MSDGEAPTGSKAYLSKIPEAKIALKDLPSTFEGFENWGLSSRSAIRRSGIRLKYVESYIETLTEGDWDQLTTEGASETIRTLDSELYDKILKLLKGPLDIINADAAEFMRVGLRAGG